MMEKILSGRYVLNEPIGTGGMAVVYRAWDRVDLREVAIKVLRPEYNEDADFIRRFNMEAQAASKMSHPNIVQIYGVGQDGDVRYIVMEYVKGRTLKDLIRQTGRIKPERAIQITLRILAASDHAHKSHIIHRDIKPQNIMIDISGNVKVGDFGIARATNANTQTYTDGANVLGSVHYFSPEQASGQVADEKSDLYSVGVVLYEMVTGRVPFDGETPVSVALKHVQEMPVSAREQEPSVSVGLDEVIMRALDKESSCRYQTAAEFANDLKRAIRNPRGGFVELPPGSSNAAYFHPQAREKKPLRESWNRIKKWTIATLIVLGLATLGYGGNLLYRELFVRIDLPNFSMLDVEDAVRQLDALGLKYTIEEQHNEDVRMGYVLSQYPAAGEGVWPDAQVQLIISSGKEKLLMPNLLELTRSEAVRVIEENDLVLGDVTLEISSSAPGMVVMQIPTVNEWVKPGDRVNLKISGESSVMPNFVGLSLDEAIAAAIAAGFEIGEVTEVLSEEDAGIVLTQSAPPDQVTLMGAKINVTVSQAVPISYRAQTTVVVQVPEQGVNVTCTLVESTGEREIYRATLTDPGSQSIKLDMDTLEPGTHVVRIYLDGEPADQKEIEFIEEE